MSIKELPIQVANQIAAGEVVERPASVVKELVENALDAGASEITIKVEEAGLSLISVTDDGRGMSCDDLNLAFKRHATSKIYRPEDLFRIRSLGFRGEALPSIASVSEVTIQSSDGKTGRRLSLLAGEIVDQDQSALRKGTDIKVENLFFNTPARLKYIKSLKTELAHISDVVNRLAMSHPQVRFLYQHEEKILLETNGKGHVAEVLAGIYGYKQARDMIAISGEEVNFKVTGYISKPELTRASKNYMSLFVNGRYIKNYALNQAIIKGYGSKLMIGRYPIAAIYIELDPQLVDVNVHPTKQEVRISSEADLYQLIMKAVSEALTPIQRIPSIHTSHKDEKGEEDRWQSRFSQEEDLEATRKGPTREKFEQGHLDFSSQAKESFSLDQKPIESNKETHHMPQFLTDYVQVDDSSNDDFQIHEDKVASLDQELAYLDTDKLLQIPSGHQEKIWDTVKKTNQEQLDSSKHFPDLNYAGQIQGTYLACYNEDGMYLVDQHAAQERIKYEYYRESIVDYGQSMQSLLFPIVLDYTQAEKIVIDQLKEKLADMGVMLEEFGTSAYIVQKHPLWMGKKNIQSIMEDLIALAIEDPNASLKDYREATAIMMSCKRSIKANHYLDDNQARRLLADLSKCENPYNCPHGRPVLVHFSNYEIERLFKRIQDPHQARQ
ncbi:DNA mismatch repair endonuclease MutL [Aerococcus kribbianus]|uniref:DNA mismatch repair protein MutL n=1 Tax=Aerococcus kribbianus TaxID=2999064 RepID=A0A9X3FWT0_9LACT|nr:MULTISPECIES: DNA mismatch repair endonuclease MutL [unclassified Aerococcus]MCZ0717674.1 DNA mismatch repair endonuclease MutL [Aerococcus sp. YH-aer221]MCZ0725962.1 DNA mismatch repair endonuclease MutL [Aerococcus sp. YH-aer222]